MIVGIPREIKEEEQRVALTPAGAGAFVAHGHTVLVERGAGAGSSLPDRLYAEAGATLAGAPTVWSQAELILKVKEPLPAEYPFLRPGLLLFTYLHLAANPDLARVLVARRVQALAYETLQLDSGALPLLAPMSEVAGRLACQVAVGVGAHVSILDVDPAKLRYVHDIVGGHVTTVMSNRANIEEEVAAADLVIGAVLIPGARAPQLLPRALVRAMRPGAAIVDVAIDQGGCAETSRPTTHARPTFVAEGVVHYCVENMPGIVPHTSTFALTNVTLSYALALADLGLVE